MSQYPLRNVVRIILLNENNELLLMCIDDPQTKPIKEKYKGPFWTLVGGEIKKEETLLEAATRELFEETGINKKNVLFGPVVWFGEFDLLVYGKPTHMKQTFIVAKTKQKDVFLAKLTASEKKTVKNLVWFSLEKIMNRGEIIYPIVLPDYLPNIIKEIYPKKPIKINLKLPMTDSGHNSVITRL